jgi:heat shock protein HslJ
MHESLCGIIYQEPVKDNTDCDAICSRATWMPGPGLFRDQTAMVYQGCRVDSRVHHSGVSMRAKGFLAAVMSAAVFASAALAHEEKLEGSEWGVVGEDGAGARFVSFAGSGRLFGFAGCNRFTGSFEQHDGHLAISPLAVTRMACAPDAMAKETQFLEMLAKARGVKVDHTLLLFLDEAGAGLQALSRRNAEPASGSDEE